MQELKCSRCGADLGTHYVEGEGLYGRCTHCRTSYLIQEVDRSHVVVDVRLPEGMPDKRHISRRSIVFAGAVLAGATAIAALPRLLSFTPAGEPRPTTKPIWNIGGPGAGPGEFRDNIAALTIDGQGRSALTVSSSPVVQLFDGDGRFLARWVTGSKTAQLLVALPGGDLIIEGPDGLERRDPLTGRVKALIREPDYDLRGGTEKVAPTPDGGFAIYYARDSSSISEPRKGLPDDRIVYFGADGTQGRAVGPLIGKVFVIDPAVPDLPAISSMAVDGAGTIYLLFHKKEDYDTREGIYVFNPDGVFLRKIEIEQKYHGDLAATADGTLFHTDPWMTRMTRIKAGKMASIDMTDLERDPQMDLGIPHFIAAFPNGDLGVATGSQRYLRIRWPDEPEG